MDPTQRKRTMFDADELEQIAYLASWAIIACPDMVNDIEARTDGHPDGHPAPLNRWMLRSLLHKLADGATDHGRDFALDALTQYDAHQAALRWDSR